MSTDNVMNLWLGTFIEAPSPQVMFITNLVVFPPVKTPIAASGQGEIDYEVLRRRAETKSTTTSQTMMSKASTSPGVAAIDRRGCGPDVSARQRTAR